MNIARTTLSSKLLTQHKDHFTSLAVNAVLCLKGSGNLEAIQIIKKLGGEMSDSYLEEGMLRFDLLLDFTPLHIYVHSCTQMLTNILTHTHLIYLVNPPHTHNLTDTHTHTHTHTWTYSNRFPPREEGWRQPTQEIREGPDPYRQHCHGYRQDQSVWVQSSCRLYRKSGRT